MAPWEFSVGLDLTSGGSLQSPLCECLWIETRFPEIFCVPASRVLHAVCVFASFKIISECACYVKQQFLFPSWQRVPLTWWLFWERIVQGPKSCCLILLKYNETVMCHLQVFPKLTSPKQTSLSSLITVWWYRQIIGSVPFHCIPIFAWLISTYGYMLYFKLAEKNDEGLCNWQIQPVIL